MFTKKLNIFITILAVGFSHGLLAFENQTFEKVIESKFKDCSLTKENVFLNNTQEKKIKEKLNSKVSSLLLRFKTDCQKEKSYIYVDSHNVRTLNETVVVEIKNNKLNFLEIASFMEPKEYLPPRKWLDLFYKKEISKVDALTGATLSQNAIKNVVKKYLVIDSILLNE